MAQAQIAFHAAAAQVQVAVLEPHAFVHGVVFVYGERQRLGPVEDAHLFCGHLDFARGEFGVFRARRSGPNPALHLHHPFHPHRFQVLVGLGLDFRAGHHLDDAAFVSEVQENHAAVVSTPVDPARQGHGLPRVFFAQRAAAVGFVHVAILSREGLCRVW